MLMRKTCVGSLTASLLFLTVLAGCGLTGNMIEPPFDTGGKKIVFVPFRERDLYYFESGLGMEISALLAHLVRSKSNELKVVDIAPAEALIKGRDPDAIDWQEVGRATGADYIVLGFIKTLRAKDPEFVNCYKGRFYAQIALIQAATGAELMREDVTTSYPSDNFAQPFLSVVETTEDEVLQKVKERGVIKMAELFYPHPPPEE
jgi:TolB-like protein